ncbi:hypothetical protein STEG23_036758, partial [Scotinomys teguina]
MRSGGCPRPARASVPLPYPQCPLPERQDARMGGDTPVEGSNTKQTETDTVYILALVGNCSLLFIIKTDSSLHEPMYLFLCMLAVADLVVCTTAVPKLLSLFWFHDGEIPFEACLTQVFLIHSCSTMESGFFLAMAFDRYIAICNPLRHSAILTHTVTGRIGLAIVLRGLALLSPHPFLLSWLPYCKTNIISHTYCEFMALIKIACAETRIRRAYSLIVAFLTGGVDFILIICSYVLILNTVFHLPSKDARLKTLGTCGSHICVILVSYTPAFFSFLTHSLLIVLAQRFQDDGDIEKNKVAHIVLKSCMLRLPSWKVLFIIDNDWLLMISRI